MRLEMLTRACKKICPTKACACFCSKSQSSHSQLKIWGGPSLRFFKSPIRECSFAPGGPSLKLLCRPMPHQCIWIRVIHSIKGQFCPISECEPGCKLHKGTFMASLYVNLNINSIKGHWCPTFEYLFLQSSFKICTFHNGT